MQPSHWLGTIFGTLERQHFLLNLMQQRHHGTGKHAMTDAPDRILRLQSVLDRTGLKRSPLYRKMENGSFPRQLKLSARCAGWRESAVNEWMRNPMFYSVRRLSRAGSPSPCPGLACISRATRATSPETRAPELR
jgi:prophage regulatory protein